MACHQSRIQHTTGYKGCCCTKHINEYKTDECQRCTEHHVQYIHFTGMSGFVVKLMHNDRQCHQCQEFVEQVHCQEVRSEGDTDNDTKCHNKEGEESVFVTFMGHIFKGVNCCHDPQQRYHGTKYLGQAIHMQCQGQFFAELEQCHFRAACAENCIQCEDRIDHNDGQYYSFTGLSVRKFYRQQTSACNDRKDHR